MEDNTIVKDFMGEFAGESRDPATAATVTHEGICVGDSTPTGPLRPVLPGLQATSVVQGSTAPGTGLVNVTMTEQMLSFLSYACMRQVLGTSALSLNLGLPATAGLGAPGLAQPSQVIPEGQLTENAPVLLKSTIVVSPEGAQATRQDKTKNTRKIGPLFPGDMDCIEDVGDTSSQTRPITDRWEKEAELENPAQLHERVSVMQRHLRELKDVIGENEKERERSRATTRKRR